MPQRPVKFMVQPGRGGLAAAEGYSALLHHAMSDLSPDGTMLDLRLGSLISLPLTGW